MIEGKITQQNSRVIVEDKFVLVEKEEQGMLVWFEFVWIRTAHLLLNWEISGLSMFVCGNSSLLYTL